MIVRTVRQLCAALLCCAAVASSCAAEMVDLKFKPVPNQVQKLKTTIEQKVTNNIGGNAQTLTQTIGLGYGFTTKEVAADGTATVVVTFDSVTFKQASNLSTVEYDSANPPATVQPMARGFAALAGQTFTMKVSSTGKVTEVAGLDAMVDAILKRLELPEGPAKAIVEKSVRKEFGEDAVRDNMEIMLAVYPEQAVQPGQSWTRKIAMSKGIPMVMENTFTLKDATAEVATLDLKGKLSTNADVPPMDLGSRKITYTLKGTVVGTMKIARDSGWVRAAEMTQTVAGEMSADAGAGRVTKTPITVDTKIVLEAK